jgi:hypothetical protein
MVNTPQHGGTKGYRSTALYTMIQREDGEVNAENLPETLPTGVLFAVDERFEIRTEFRFNHSHDLPLPP